MKKILHFEIFRIIAIISIIYVHTGGAGYEVFTYTDNNVEYTVSLLLGIFCRLSVRLFFMISGALLMTKDESWKKVYQKRVMRMLAVLILFTTGRYLYECIIAKTMIFSFKELFWILYEGGFYTPYWFLYTYISILLILPFLRGAVKNLTVEGQKYMIVLMMIFNVVVPIIGHENAIFAMFESNLCYFLLGYILQHGIEEQHFNKKNACIILGAAAVCMAATFILVTNNYFQGGELAMQYIEAFTMPLGGCVFYLGRYWSLKGKELPEKASKIITHIGGCMFGIYLLEEEIRNAMSFVYLKTIPYMSGVAASLLWAAAAVCAGVVLVTIMKKLPILRRLL